jgi:hypothetical protein
LSAGEVTQVVSTVFAAVAAVAAAITALVVYRQWAATVTPTPSVDTALHLPSRLFVLTVFNHGGPVKKVSFAVIEGNQACLGFLPPHAFLASGQNVRVKLQLDPTEDTGQTAVAYGFDLAGRYVYAWAANGQSGRWPARSRRLRRRPTDLTAAQILQRFYPGAADPMTLEVRASELMPQETAAKRGEPGG